MISNVIDQNEYFHTIFGFLMANIRDFMRFVQSKIDQKLVKNQNWNYFRAFALESMQSQIQISFL